MIGIDRQPPALTGNTKQDIEALQNYTQYLVERMNYILTLLNKRIGG